MIFERERCKPIRNPSRARIVRELASVRSSFASLTAADGAYLQVAGGPGLFLLEWRASDSTHHRGAQETPVVPFPDGTILSFSGGRVSLSSNEWFLAAQVAEVFDAFLSGAHFPSWLSWHVFSSEFTRAGE